MADERDRSASVKGSQTRQRFHDAFLYGECTLTTGHRRSRTAGVEGAPRGILFEIREALPGPGPEIDLREFVTDLDRYALLRRDRVCRGHGALERTRVDRGERV